MSLTGRTSLSRGVVDYFDSNFNWQYLSFSWCAAVTHERNLSLKVALPALVNKIEREFAGTDLMNSYGVAERFVKN